MKTFKKVLTLVMSLVLLLTGFAVLPVQAEGEGYKASLGYADPNWAVQEWGDKVNTTVTGAGTYTLSWDLGEGQAVNSAVVFVVDVAGAAADLLTQGKQFKLTDLKVKADGTDLAVDMSKVVTGDIEGKGNYRIEIYNEYGTTKEAAPIDKAALVAAKNLTVEFTVDVVAAGYTTKLGYADPNWAVQEWGDNVNTVVSGAGSYNLTWNVPEGSAAKSAVVFVVDIEGAAADLLADGKAFNLTALKVTADGTELAVDMSKVVTGDIEEKGNYRIEIYNEYGTTKEAAPVDITKLSASKTLSIDFTLEVIDAPADKQEETTPAAPAVTFDPAGKYNAYLGIQTPNWTYRDPWNSANGIGSEYWGQFIYGNETKKQYGVVTDAEVAGNGTYSVKLTDFGSIINDDFTAAKQDYFNLLYISTNIPLSEDIKITDCKIIMDGKTIKTYDEAFLDPDETEYVKILFQNIWNENVKELPFYVAPTSSVEMKFTISGFSYDNEAAKEDVPVAPTTASDPVEQPASEGNILPVVIAVVAVVAVIAVVAVVVLKKKKANK